MSGELNREAPALVTLPAGLATRAHAGTSFTPEKRGAAHVEEFKQTLLEDWNRLARRCKSDAELAVLREEFDRYQGGYRAKYTAWLLSKSRCVSWMIAGPSNFPVRRMEKRNRSEHNRCEELIAFRERALNAIRKKLWPEDHGIATSDPNAPELIRKKVAKLEDDQERMKLANKLVRQFCQPAKSRDQAEAEMKPGKLKEELLFALVAQCRLSEEAARRLLVPDFCGRIGFPGYAITNNNANIRRYKDRLKEVDAYQELEHKEEEKAGGIKVVENPEAGRIQLIFPGKPDAPSGRSSRPAASAGRRPRARGSGT
jgi:hypothetical protein